MFVLAAVCVAMIVISLFLVPLTTQNLSVPGVTGLLAVLAFCRGLQQRGYRHSRERAVAELRADIRSGGNDALPR